MIHFKDDAVGRIQLGRVNEDYWNIMEGLAGTFFVSTCRYEKGPFVSYFFRKSDDPNKYYFKTDDLANPEEEFMDPGTMDWDDELEGDFAEHMFVDPKTLVATLTTNKGNTQLWDLREGFILATNDTKIKFQACAPLNGGGYICLPENSTVITSVTFDPEKLVYAAFSRRFSERIPMLLAVSLQHARHRESAPCRSGASSLPSRYSEAGRVHRRTHEETRPGDEFGFFERTRTAARSFDGVHLQHVVHQARDRLGEGAVVVLQHLQKRGDAGPFAVAAPL